MLSIKQETDLVEEEEQRMELITAFVKSNQNTIKDINDAIETGDLKLAHRLAHTLKGVAGIVGMTALVEASQVVEHSLSTGKLEFLTDQMNMLENELKGALSKLAPFMHEHSGKIRNKNANVSLNKESALKLLEKLDSFLASDSFDSLNLVKDLGMIPGTEQLAEQVEGMKFRQARETLAIIKKQVEHDQQ
jgi:HPt (histidine-containing phosphotransfer) domain-containing protein